AGLIGKNSVGERACRHEPAAMEALAGVEWPPVIDQTTVTGTVRAGAAWIDRDTVDLDLEPAIAAGRAITALSVRCRCCRDPNRSRLAHGTRLPSQTERDHCINDLSF